METRRLNPGTYRAIDPCTVYLMQSGGRQVEYTAYKAGELIEVPATRGAFWYALAWFPTQYVPGIPAETEPRLERLEQIAPC